MNVPPHKKAPAEFEIPDLDLPAPAPQTSRSGVLALTQPLTEARRSSSYNGLPEPELELESPLGVSPPLELDSSGPIARDHSVPDYAAGRSFGSDAPEVDSAKAASTLAIGDEAGANWPTGETPPRERLRLDPTEIRLLAAFGTPSFGPLNVVYALRVAFRRLALKRALRELNRELTEAEHARDAILAELASELRPVLRESPTFERSFAPLAALDALSAERSAALSVLEGDARAELTRLASERSAERNLVTELSRQSSAAAAVADARRHARERLEAREKRCFIEIHALQAQSAERGAAAAERVAAIEAELEELRLELAEARSAEAAAEQRLAELSRSVSQRTSSANQLERRETRLRERWQRQLRERAGGLAELGEQQRAVLADVARAVLRAHGALPLDAPLLARVREADAKVSALVKRSELHLRALDAADAQKLRSGVGWLLVCLVALAALLAYRFHFAG